MQSLFQHLVLCDLTELFPLQLMERTLWGWQVVQKMRHIGNKLELMFYQNIVQKE